MAASALDPYDAVLLIGFGGPKGPEEVMPFLRRVTAGRGILDERLAEVAGHYLARGGSSPINGHNRALRAALTQELRARGHDLPVVWGNRNAAPFVADAMREAAQEHGARRVVTVLTSAYSSYSSCRQYRENLADGLSDSGVELVVDKVRPYATHPGYVEPVTRLVHEAVAPLDPQGLRLLFVTHSTPDGMNDTSGPGDGEGGLYVDQHVRVARHVVDEVGRLLGHELDGELVFCSRSGPPHQPWLEPDVGDRIRELAGEGARTVVVVPIGFVSDHMEVAYDLDTEAAGIARECGLAFVRVPTVGVDPQFVAGLVDLVEERAAQARGEQVDPAAAVPGDIRPSVCAAGCCPNLRAHRPALCGSD